MEPIVLFLAAFVSLVILFAQIKTFSIDSTLKDLLAEVQKQKAELVAIRLLADRVAARQVDDDSAKVCCSPWNMTARLPCYARLGGFHVQRSEAFPTYVQH